LKEFVANNRKYLKLADGETIKAVYRGFKILTNRFDPEKEVVSYRFSLEGMDADKVVNWECGRADVAEIMEKVKVGTALTISRTGSGTDDTKYNIQVAGSETKKNGETGVGMNAREQQDSIVSLCKENSVTPGLLHDYLKKRFNIEKRSEIPSSSFSEVVEWIKKAAKKQDDEDNDF